ncbi:hypothetical protein C9I50_08120 [Pseudomonas prosekii]|uniref:Uncharacterized protein n=1 Tax=Pseudomonas prosekii TaxID=1148509 RepID=A0A3L8CWU4_9PSED|nr:hypothetical protein [Pseudomonas prosekii]PWE43635.1 hypothetical protein C9I50_08120 [Pseudomonas prosekii]RLU07270.1 hypothetical protein CS076_19475 [Pseudomonas prosekii]RLU12460.1 hypothetical protein CS078_01800 [Pseudomonas prosekii]
MKPGNRKAKLVLIAGFHTEALRLAGNVSATQRRFLEVAEARGKELEPSGWLAGYGAPATLASIAKDE